jgi:hypothetical protein
MVWLIDMMGPHYPLLFPAMPFTSKVDMEATIRGVVPRWPSRGAVHRGIDWSKRSQALSPDGRLCKGWAIAPYLHHRPLKPLIVPY